MRFEHPHAPLRTVVQRVVEQFLDCARLHGGFARLYCPSCRGEHLLAFGCQTQDFCPRYQAKRGALFAEYLAEEILAPVPHRHVLFTVLRILRGLFERERRLFSILPRCTHRCVESFLHEVVDDPRTRVGTIASIQTFGSYGANFHPHVHALVTERAFHLPEDGPRSSESVPWWDLLTLTELFRHFALRELFLDELELIRRLCVQIPAPRQHLVRYYGHYTDRTRRVREETDVAVTPPMHDSPTGRARRPSWARLLKRIFEVDPLLCPQCQVEMMFVVVIRDFSVVHRILARLLRREATCPPRPHPSTGPTTPSGTVATGSSSSRREASIVVG